jgi:hypothetical protein
MRTKLRERLKEKEFNKYKKMVLFYFCLRNLICFNELIKFSTEYPLSSRDDETLLFLRDERISL